MPPKLRSHGSCWALTHLLTGGVRLTSIIAATRINRMAATATFNQDMPLKIMLVPHHEAREHRITHLECIFAREALVTVIAREGLDGQMNPLVALQIMVAIEALRTLITLEWSIVSWGLLRCVGPRLAIHWWICLITAVVCHRKHCIVHVSHHRHLCTGTVDVRHDWSRHSGQGI